MTIAIDARCLEWQRGGVARYLLHMLQCWTQGAGAESFLLYFQNFVPTDDILRHPRIKCRLLRGPRFLRKRRIIAEQLLLPLMLWRDRPRILFSPWYTSPLAWPGSRTVVAAWDITYTTHPAHYSLANRISLGWFSRLACKRAQRILTCSSFDGQQISKFYNVEPSKIGVILLAVEDKFRPSSIANVAALRTKYSLPPRFLLSLGNLYNRRNVDVIIKAFTAIRKKIGNVKLVVIGKNLTEPRIDIEALLAPLVQENRAIYMKWLPEEDLVAMYSAAWYYISTSDADGEAMMLKEAMKCGTPVITSRLLAEAVGGHGVIAENPADEKELCEIFARVLTDEVLRGQLASEGREWVQRFTWPLVAAETRVHLDRAAGVDRNDMEAIG